MSKLIQVKPEVNRLIKFMSDIEEGNFKIPTFQRDFVWGNKEKIDLFDSISKEYPIGSILLWQPEERFAHKDEIGPYVINTYDNKSFFYILDGFQRLSTLFGCLTNPYKTKLVCDQIKLKREFSMFYDLEEQAFNMATNRSISNIPVYILLDTFAFLDYLDSLRREIKDEFKSKILVDRARKLSSTLIDYSIPSIQIFGGTIKDAVDIFSRVNSKGIAISQDWMLSALTSSEEDNFNLGELLGELLTDLNQYNFGDIKRDILVQCIQTSFGKIYFDQTLEEFANNPDFKIMASKAISSIRKSIKFLFEELLVIDRRLLPYNNQLIFITYFFNEIPQPSVRQLQKIKEWFWITTYSNYFTIYSLSKIRRAFEQFKRFVANEDTTPIYHDTLNKEFATADLPKNVSAKSVRSNAFVLFLLNHSNQFRRIDSSIVDTFKVGYLIKDNTTHANIVPAIDFIDERFNNQKFIVNKNFGIHSLISKSADVDIEIAQKLFLTEGAILAYLHNDNFGFLLGRMRAIVNAERQFVEQFGIRYNYTDSIDDII